MLNLLKSKKCHRIQAICFGAENYYQNQLLIDNFLKNHPPTIYAKAIFHGDRDGIDTQVEWTIVDKPDKNASS